MKPGQEKPNLFLFVCPCECVCVWSSACGHVVCLSFFPLHSLSQISATIVPNFITHTHTIRMPGLVDVRKFFFVIRFWVRPSGGRSGCPHTHTHVHKTSFDQLPAKCYARHTTLFVRMCTVCACGCVGLCLHTLTSREIRTIASCVSVSGVFNFVRYRRQQQRHLLPSPPPPFKPGLTLTRMITERLGASN